MAPAIDRTVATPDHQGDRETSAQHYVRNRRSHHGGDGTATDDCRRCSSSFHASTSQSSSFHDHGHHAQSKQRGCVDDQEKNVVGRSLRKQEKPLRDTEPDVIHYKSRLIPGMRKQRVVNVLAIEKVRDRQRYDGGQRRTPVNQCQQQDADRKNSAHRHVEAVEKWGCPLEAIGIQSNESGTCDGQHRSDQRQRAPDPYDHGYFVGNGRRFLRGSLLSENQDGSTCFLVSLVAEFFSKAFSDKHLERRETGNDHYKQDKRGIVSCRARHEPEHGHDEIENHQRPHDQREVVEDAIRVFPALQRDLIHLRAEN